MAAREGHRLIIILVALAVVQIGLALGLRQLGKRIRVPPGVRRAAVATAVTIMILALVFGVTRYGPRARHEFFTRSPPSGLNDRLFSFSSSGRVDLWSVSWRRFGQSPWAGSGPGTYEITWMSERTYGFKVRDAHNLYAESLAELGLAGTALLLLVLVLPLSASLRGRQRRLVPVAAGAYAAFLVHAGVDWDWEMPAVTGTALLCGVAVLAASRPAVRSPLPWWITSAVVTVMIVVAVFSFAGVVGQRALASAEDAASAGAPVRAVRDARRAATWQPWSSEALRVQGEAQLALGRRRDARSTLSRAVAKDPRSWELWFDLAVASEGEARMRAARRAERLNPLSPQIAEARDQLGLEPAG